MLAHVVLLAYGAAVHSPVWDEIGHLPSGIVQWKYDAWELYRVNPPLVRMWATLPLLATDAPAHVRPLVSPDARIRTEFVIGKEFIDRYGSRAFEYFTLARWACIPLSVLGGVVCWRWSAEWYGRNAGLVAVTLWSFCPNLLGHGQLMTPDAGASALALAAVYAYWKWLEKPSAARMFLAGLALGAAELAKFTLLAFYGVLPLLWLVWVWRAAPRESRAALLRPLAQLMGLVLISVFVVNLGYGFSGTGKRLGDFTFYSETLTGHERGTGIGPGNRFANSVWGQLPVPVPEHFLTGVDLQKVDFERGLWSYLRGRWEPTGWWYYYLYALAVKTPVGVLFLAVLAAARSISATARGLHWSRDIILLAPALGILALVSSQTGMNHHMRYVLPALPFLLVWTSRAGQLLDAVPAGWARRIQACAVLGMLAWSVASSLWVYPHSLSYFNELAGGPKNGHFHLTDSNIDWAQDLLKLRDWVHNHPDAKMDGFAYFPGHLIDPGLIGLPSTPPPSDPRWTMKPADTTDDELGPQPGWYALGVTRLRERDRRFEYFLRFEPAAMAGYGIYIYQVSEEDAARVRRELGLPALPPNDARRATRRPASALTEGHHVRNG
ncbi:MAG: glycosyltransferase family 39 protein [Planctomycetia bacterium]|nr:glycosyltransferase family 39 protein [Planctomycetia bacterium]